VGRLRHMALRDLPSVDALTHLLIAGTEIQLPRPLVQAIARDAIEEARSDIKAGGHADPEVLGRPRINRLAASRPTRVINATGVLLHTNLGRAPVSEVAAAAGKDQHVGYGNLEFDLITGSRGGRGAYQAELLTSLTGSEAALAVNNNAAALFLSLSALAHGGDVLVSRGELIEIGGSFRLPTLMEASGARLVEVGTTNRTRAQDYISAIKGAGLVLKVHPSNYRIEGFAQEVGYRELAELAHAGGVPFVADLGSGLLDSRTPWLKSPPPGWLANEPAVRQTLEAGADIVLFSGDKLLGGPQAGIAVGSSKYIDMMRRHPIARAVRLDGPTNAALAVTLESYASGRGDDIPFWRMASLDYGALEDRHRAVLAASGVDGEVVESSSVPGAGSVPGEAIRSPAIGVNASPDRGWKHLISASPPIVARRRDGTLQLDLRTVSLDDDAAVAAALRGLT
jgi:L-seryl-tRNA(Ser) seleniumtransferase